MNKLLGGTTQLLRVLAHTWTLWKVRVLNSCFPAQDPAGSCVSLSGHVPRAHGCGAQLSFQGLCFRLRWPQAVERPEQTNTVPPYSGVDRCAFQSTLS